MLKEKLNKGENFFRIIMPVRSLLVFFNHYTLQQEMKKEKEKKSTSLAACMCAIIYREMIRFMRYDVMYLVF